MFYIALVTHIILQKKNNGVIGVSVTVNESNIFSRVVSAESLAEQSIDIEFSLPDYCPEINKILKCFCDVAVLSKTAMENCAELGGQISVSLLYEDQDNSIATFNYVCPFTKHVDLNGACEGDHLMVVTRSPFINTKAVAPRKVEIHGSVMMNVKAHRIVATKVISSILEDYICQKQTDIEYSKPLKIIEKNIYLEDDFSIGQNRPSISKIIRANASPTIKELKQVGNKLIIKGDVKIEVLYLSAQHNSPITVTESCEFSQVAECDSALDAAKCLANVNVLTTEFRTKTSLDGEARIIAFEIKLAVGVECYETECVSVVTDAFACKCPAEITTEEILMEKYLEPLSENFVLKKNLDFSDGQLSEVYDVFCDANIDYHSVDDNTLTAKGVVTIFILGRNSEHEAVLYERNVDFEYRYEFNEIMGDIACEPNIKIVAVNFSKGMGNDVDIAVEMCICANIFSKFSTTALTDIKCDLECKTDSCDEIAAVIYFASNETAWDIAKRYGTSAELICNLNNLENCDTVCNKKLLIPLV